MKKEKSTKEKILKALEDKPKKKIRKVKITQKMCDEINELSKKIGIDRFPDWKPRKPHSIKILIK